MHMYVCLWFANFIVAQPSSNPSPTEGINSYYCELITLFMYFSIDNDDNASTGVIIGSILSACVVVMIVILLVVMFKKFKAFMKYASKHHPSTLRIESSHTARSLFMFCI